VIGIPSYHNAETLPPVIQAAITGLRGSFPHARGLIAVAEGGSVEKTRASLESLRDPAVSVLISPYPVDLSGRFLLPYHGIPERRKAVWALLHIAETLQAKACAILDPRLFSLTPQWIEALLDPTWNRGFDYVSPVHARHRYEGGLANLIAYPLTRALYGKEIRYPLGGEFAVSGPLITQYLSNSEIWTDRSPLPEIDLWMAMSAAVGDHRLCQVHLGPRLIEGPSADLSSTVCQVVGSLFQLAENYQSLWQKGVPESHLPTFGTPAPSPATSPSMDPHSMIQAFQRGLRDLLPLWEQALSPDTLQDLYPLGSPGVTDFRFSMDLWVRVIYDMLLAFHYRIFYWRHLLKALVPLYLGRLASLIMETEKGSEAEVEESTQLLCQRFVALKPYLAERWR